MKSTDSVSGQTPRKMHTYVHQKICSRILRATVLVIASNQKLPKSPSTREWINTFWYSYNGILYSSKNAQFIGTCNIWVNLRNITLSLKRQLQKDTVCFPLYKVLKWAKLICVNC